MIMQHWNAATTTRHMQLHTHISVPYWSPDVCLGLKLLRDIQFGLTAFLKNSVASYDNKCHEQFTCRKWAWQLNIWGVLRAPVAESPFLNPPLTGTGRKEMYLQ